MLIKAEREQFFSVKTGQNQNQLANSDTFSRDLATSTFMTSSDHLDSTSTSVVTGHTADGSALNGTGGGSLDEYEIHEIHDKASSNRNRNHSELDREEEEEAEAAAAAIHYGHIRKLLYHLARNHLQSNDWKRLARFWDFTEDQIKAIEHQYTGKTSYKDHAYRMLLIWLHGLSPSKNPLNELYDALIYINKEEVAEKMRKKAEDRQHGGGGSGAGRFNCRCLPAIPSGVCHYCSIL